MTNFLTETELDGIKKIRRLMKGEIPKVLDTDYNLGRWWRSYSGNINQLLPKIRTYLSNRKAGGFDREDLTEIFYDIPIIKKFSPYLAMSRVGEKNVNSIDNALVFIEGAITEPDKLVRVMKTSDYVQMFLGFCEYFQLLVLHHEKKTGKPSYGICVYDMSGSNVAHYANPFAPINRLMYARVQLWQDFYGELLQKVIIVNPPPILTAIWKVAQFLVDAKFHRKFVFASRHEDILEHLTADVIPVAFGGKLKDRTENCCNERKTIEQKDYCIPGNIWKEVGLEPPKLEQMVLRNKQSFTLQTLVSTDGVLLWQFWTNTEILFAITKCLENNTEEMLIYPELKLLTTKLPEEGKIICKPGVYNVKFRNINNFFNLKLQYAVKFIEQHETE